MAKKLIDTIWTGNVRVVVYLDSEWHEYIVRLFVNGKAKGMYVAENRQDAIDSAHKIMLGEWNRQRVLGTYVQGNTIITLQANTEKELGLVNTYTVVRTHAGEVVEMYSSDSIVTILKIMGEMTLKIQSFLVVSEEENGNSNHE